jgi:DNA-binding NtrC family response regulator
VRPEHLPTEVLEAQKMTGTRHLRTYVDEVERRSIEDALDATRGNQTKAAVRLGISRRTLLNKMAKYAIKGPRQKNQGR